MTLGGVFVGEIEIGQFQAGGDGLFVADGAGDFEACAGIGGLEEIGFDAKGITRSDELPVFDVAGFLEHDDRAGEISLLVQEPAGGLRGGFEHQNPGQNGESGEMIGEIFLGQRHLLGGDDAVFGEQFDLVYQIKLQNKLLQPLSRQSLASGGMNASEALAPRASAGILPRNMQMTELAIEGVRLLDLQRYADSRGSFCEAFRASWLGHELPWVQWNVSHSASGTIRGLHVHRRQTDYWHIVDGRVLAAVMDIRPGSASRGKALCVPLDASRPQALVIPPGVLHGFRALEKVILMYLLDREYDPTDELGVRWDDRALGLPEEWYEAENPLLSGRDATACMLKDLKI